MYVPQNIQLKYCLKKTRRGLPGWLFVWGSQNTRDWVGGKDQATREQVWPKQGWWERSSDQGESLTAEYQGLGGWHQVGDWGASDQGVSIAEREIREQYIGEFDFLILCNNSHFYYVIYCIPHIWPHHHHTPKIDLPPWCNLQIRLLWSSNINVRCYIKYSCSK